MDNKQILQQVHDLTLENQQLKRDYEALKRKYDFLISEKEANTERIERNAETKL